METCTDNGRGDKVNRHSSIVVTQLKMFPLRLKNLRGEKRVYIPATMDIGEEYGRDEVLDSFRVGRYGYHWVQDGWAGIRGKDDTNERTAMVYVFIYVKRVVLTREYFPAIVRFTNRILAIASAGCPKNASFRIM